MLKRLVEARPGSPSTRFRRRRFALFRSLVDTVPRPLRILDVGGTESFWETMGFADEPDIEVTLLNLAAVDVTRANFTSVAGDAADLSRYAAASFDVVLSNSVIEHVETYERQAAMASEVQRVGRRFFVQTPNRWFPLEPHFLFPFFQFLPLEMRVLLLGRFDLGWHKRVRDKRAARAEVLSIRLMSGAELRRLFPGATMYRERFLGVTKSFVVYGGWDT